MTRNPFYPGADRSQWYGNGNATVSPDKVLWHTTETPGGWPSYAGGSTAPNYTYDPWKHQWRQHFPNNGTARALKNGPNGYSTNRKGPVQVEISCYCDPSKVSTGKHISQLDARAYDDMHKFSEWQRVEWGIPLRSTVTFKPYPSSYGNNGVRLGAVQFQDYTGHLGHQHAYANDHGDPGNIDIARILRSPVPKPPEKDMPLNTTDIKLIHDEIVRILRAPEFQLGVGPRTNLLKQICTIYIPRFGNTIRNGLPNSTNTVVGPNKEDYRPYVDGKGIDGKIKEATDPILEEIKKLSEQIAKTQSGS